MRFEALYPAEAIESFLESASRHEGDECVLWPFGRLPSGYGRFSKNGKNVYAHREVCRRAHGEPPFSRAHAAHGCGNGSGGCVNRKHLRWATPTQNAADKIMHGTSLAGERNHRSKLTADQVVAIRQDGRATRDIAKAFGVTASNVSHIKRADTWALAVSGCPVTKPADPRRGEGNVRATLTAEQAMKIYLDPRMGIDVAQEYGVTTSCVSAIRHGKSWAWLTGHKTKACA